MADYYVREEDGTSKFILEDASGDYLLETQPVQPDFIASVTATYTPTLAAASVQPDFIASVTAVSAPLVQDANVYAPFISSTTVVYTAGFPAIGFNPISEDFLGNPAEYEQGFGQDYDDFTLEEVPAFALLIPPFIPSLTVVYDAGISPEQISVPTITSVTTLYGPSLYLTGDNVTISVAGAYTWLCPSGVTTAYVIGYGGGGGGGDHSGPTEAGGGGGGAFSGRAAMPVTPGTSYTFTVGAHGTHAIPGTAGTDTTFTGDSSTQVVAKGGSGGANTAGGAGGAAASCIGDTGLKFSGGAGGNGGGAQGGGGGASGNTSATGNAGQNGPGTGSGPVGGVGANGGGSGGHGGQNVNITAGVNPGGGGGGGGSGDSGANGADGSITISTGRIFPTFISSVTIVYDPHTNPGTITPPFIGSVTVVYAPGLPGQVNPPFISSNTILYAPRVQIAFTGGAVSQVALEVTGNSTADPDARVSQVTLELLVPWYDGLHIWEKTGQTGG